jgi:uncharacterized membrane protein YobD (UPF0266 family)
MVGNNIGYEFYMILEQVIIIGFYVFWVRVSSIIVCDTDI